MASTATLGLGKGRIEALTDGIFATVMTVLVLSLSIPTILGGTNPAITSYVLGLGSTAISYVLSFLTLGVFWVRHHNIFHFISRVNNTFLWLNMFFLLTVGFVPFSTELIGRFPNAEISTIIYGSNLIASGLCLQAIWLYSMNRKLLIADGLDERVMSRINKRLTGGPVLYAGAILASLIFPDGSELALGIYIAALVYYIFASSRWGWRLSRGTVRTTTHTPPSTQ
ncbi:MAG: DUF1211 domain-containing protein [Nitrososphaerota archaeon]|nr:DUF1211 domain-containing protein [Nitrososphaerota archaeon]